MRNYLKVIVLGALVALVSCQQSEKLTISGNIANAEGDTLTISHLVQNVQTVVETKVLKSSGQFKFSLDKQQYPEYYFLQVNKGHQLVIIRDSSDVINIQSDNAKFKDANIEGSNVSVRIQEMMQQVGQLRVSYRKFLKDIDKADAETQKQLSDKFIEEYDAVKESIGAEIYKDPKSYYSYYALFQRIASDNLLFSPYNQEDYKYYAVVATSYDMYYKEDPRTIALYDMVEGVLAERRKAQLQKMVDEAPGGLPDIVMNDAKGVERKLSDLNGKVVILNFWASKSPDSRVVNKQLLKLYNKYKSRGLAIYQVSADKSKILWEEAVKQDQLPWINVCDFQEGASRAFMIYNVKQVPTTFLVGRDGEMINKFSSVVELENAIVEAL